MGSPPLESLSFELRKYIYELSGGLWNDSICLGRPETVIQPAITEVSELTRNETLPMFYSNHQFVLQLLSQTGPEKARILQWLNASGPMNASRLRTIHIIHARKQDRKTIESDFLRDMRARGVSTSQFKTTRITAPFNHCDESVLEAIAEARGM